MLAETLTHLEALVAFDTRNPPRSIGRAGLIDYLATQLDSFVLEIEEVAPGSWIVFARRGEPNFLIHAHLDTVPEVPGWSGSPFELRISDGRAYGLGTCDTKGAVASCLAAAQTSSGPCALLLTTDEEGPGPCGVKRFLEGNWNFDGVIVCEPTSCQAVVAHRAISSVRLRFRGHAGHSSVSDATSAVHSLIRWGAAALDLAARYESYAWRELRGFRLNLGVVSGGIKSNVVAPEAELAFGMRPLPSWDIDEIHEEMKQLVARECLLSYEETFRGPALPAGVGDTVESKLAAAESLRDRLGLAVGAAVDFWTEASWFSSAGMSALVYGPGSIAEAHSPNEWVSLAELEEAAQTFRRIFDAHD